MRNPIAVEENYETIIHARPCRTLHSAKPSGHGPDDPQPGRLRDRIGADVASGLADLEAYGQLVLANPDFVARVKTGAAMNEADRASFFGGAAPGYTDYPALEAATAA
jgi:2,4-dienoyl-CoA reductase-like NADH-dependent reductase (Old Yellow Enzyme family)